MGKRIFLFLLTNATVLVVVGAILYALNVAGVLSGYGVSYLAALMVICLLWGMIGAFIAGLVWIQLDNNRTKSAFTSSIDGLHCSATGRRKNHAGCFFV